MKLRVVMADPAGNRTAIVRTPVPPGERPGIAAALLDMPLLRAEQAGFETAPVAGGKGRLEMMGGEFCGNAARSYGYLVCRERQSGHPGHLQKEEKLPVQVSDCTTGNVQIPDRASASVRIEISGSPAPLEVVCDLSAGTSYAEMPLPDRITCSEEGSPLVISEGITHMILPGRVPEDALVRRLVDKYGQRWDAFGMMFLQGESLIPAVYVRATGSLVYESSCGSGSLAAAWYLYHWEQKQGKKEEEGMASSSAKNMGFGPVGEEGQDLLYSFQEPGGVLCVRISCGQEGHMTARMGGPVLLEKELQIEI